MFRVFISLLCFTASLFAVPVIQSGSYAEQSKLLAPDAALDQWYGYSVAISGDAAIVAAPHHDRAGLNYMDYGMVYFYTKDANGTFAFEQNMTEADLGDYSGFGISADLEGDYAIVGADYDDNGLGSAYLYKRSGSSFAKLQKLEPAERLADDYFGTSVAMTSNYAAAGVPSDDDNGTDSGTVYVYTNVADTYGAQQILRASDAEAGDSFGTSIDISGDYLIAGAHRSDDNGSMSGSAYIFKNVSGTFVEQQKLLAFDANASDYFGANVAIEGDYVLISAHGDDDNGTGSGSVHLFKNSGSAFEPIAKLRASDAAASGSFGKSLSISGGVLAIGSSSGIYIFHNDGSDNFIETSKLSASDATVSDEFGSSVALDGYTVIAGAHKSDGNGTDSGSAFIFEGTIKQSVAENTTATVLEINATAVTTLNIGGEDASRFNFNDVTGELTFITPPDHESPNDNDSDNLYRLQVTASDGVLSSSRAIEVTVTDVALLIQNSYTLEEINTLTASDGAAADRFGFSVAISGDTAIVGALGDDNGANTDQGSAYLFERNATTSLFQQVQKLTASDGAAHDTFGVSVAISGETAIVGAYGDEIGANVQQGSAYIFERNATTGLFEQTRKLTASDGTAYDRFGVSVAISGETAIVGANYDDDKGQASGSVYLFEHNATSGVFEQTRKLTASDGTAEDLFGTSVAISGGTVCIGKSNYSMGLVDRQGAYIFDGVAKADVAENTATTVLDIDTTDNSSYSLTGVDYEHFDINASTGEIAFKTPPDYENPDDNNSDGIYELYVTANDGLSTQSRYVRLTLTDLDDETPTIVRNTTLLLSEGARAVITEAVHLSAADVDTDDANVTFTMTYPLSHGYLEHNDSLGVPVSGFTQQQLLDGKINYVHDDSETLYDVFVFSVSDPAGNILTDQVFFAAITPVDDTPPEGYNASFDLSDINASQTSLVSFDLSNAEIGSTYDFTVSSNRCGSDVVGSGTVYDVNVTIVLPDLSGLCDGTLTLSVTLTDNNSNTGVAATHTATLDAVVEGIAVTISDNNTSEAGDNNATFGVKLMSQPVYNVEINLTSSDLSEGVVIWPVSKLLTFTPADWNNTKDVNVTGIDDSASDGDIAYRIDLNAASADSEYDGKSAMANLINIDNENGGISPALIMYLLN